MKPAAFAYYAPASVDEAVRLLAELGPQAKLLAGGQSLIPVLNMRLARPEALIDLNRLSELRYLRLIDGYLCIGATTKHRDVERSELVGQTCPLLQKAVCQVGHVQIRNRGTIGGSLAHADPAAELPAVMCVLGAVIVVQSVRGQREIPAEHFFTGFMSTALEPDEVLVEVRVPPAPLQTGSAFVEMARRTGDFALCGAAVQVLLNLSGRLERIAVGLIGVGPRPVVPDLTDLRGEPVTDALIDEVCVRAVRAADPNSDLHASAQFRLELVTVLTTSAVKEAVAEAQRHRKGDCGT